MGSFWRHFGRLLGSSGGPWERFGDVLDAFWGPVGVPRAPWRGFGCPLEGLGAFGEVFFWSLKGLGAVLDVSEGSLGCSCGALGRFCSF